MHENLKLTVEQRDAGIPVTILHIGGWLDAQSEAQFLEAARTAYDGGVRYLLVDMHELDTITSAGMRAIQKVYQMFDAIVLHVDKANHRISLGLKQVQQRPWQAAVPGKYKVGKDVQGKVIRTTDFGAFVELEDGVEGLLHVSELSHERVNKPEDIVQVGQELILKVIKLDPEERKIGLSLRAIADSIREGFPEDEAGPGRKRRRREDEDA